MLIVIKMSYGGATSISLVSPGYSHWVGTSFVLNTSENTTTSRFFDWQDATKTTKGVEIRSNNRIYVNSDNNTGNPTQVRVNNGAWSSDVPISNGDTVNFSDGSLVSATWVVQSSHLWTTGTSGSGGGSSSSTTLKKVFCNFW